MRIGLMREQIEIWRTKKVLNEYGLETESKELFQQCPAAVKHVNNTTIGNNNLSFITTVEFTVRFNRYYKEPDNSMYVIWDGHEWDVVNNDNYWSLNKFIKLIAVKRSK